MGEIEKIFQNVLAMGEFEFVEFGEGDIDNQPYSYCDFLFPDGSTAQFTMYFFITNGKPNKNRLHDHVEAEFSGYGWSIRGMNRPEFNHTIRWSNVRSWIK